MGLLDRISLARFVLVPNVSGIGPADDIVLRSRLEVFYTALYRASLVMLYIFFSTSCPFPISLLVVSTT